jgi:hypothetical protein
MRLTWHDYMVCVPMRHTAESVRRQLRGTAGFVPQYLLLEQRRLLQHVLLVRRELWAVPGDLPVPVVLVERGPMNA